MENEDLLALEAIKKNVFRPSEPLSAKVKLYVSSRHVGSDVIDVRVKKSGLHLGTHCDSHPSVTPDHLSRYMPCHVNTQNSFNSEGGLVPRSLIVTSNYIYLCVENYGAAKPTFEHVMVSILLLLFFAPPARAGGCWLRVMCCLDM